MSKFQRKYRLEVQRNDGKGVQVIDDSLTLEFHITRQIYSSAQSGSFRVYNLSKAVRESLFKDSFLPQVFRSVKLYAGYTTILPLIFNGNIVDCCSFRQEGTTNVITEIAAQDYGIVMATARSEWTMQAGVDVPQLTKKIVVNRLIGDLQAVTPAEYQLGVGTVRDFDQDSPVISYPSYTVSNYTWDELKKVVNGKQDNILFIDNGKVCIMNPNEVKKSDTLMIDANSGLLSMPKKYHKYITCEVLFEPNLGLAQQVQLQSETANGTFKLYGLEHSGTISQAVGGKCRSIAKLFYGDEVLTRI